MSHTPVAGYNGKPSWSRGYLRQGVVHVVDAPYESLRPALQGDLPVTAVCGRTIEHVASIWGEDQWATMWGTSVRLGRTHVTDVCQRCTVKAIPRCEVCGDTPEWCQHLRDKIAGKAQTTKHKTNADSDTGTLTAYCSCGWEQVCENVGTVPDVIAAHLASVTPSA